MFIWLAAGYCRSTLSRARKWDPCPWSGLRLYLEVLTILVLHRRDKITMVDTWKMLTLLPHSCVGNAMLFNRLKYSNSGGIGTRVSIFLTAAFDALLGIREDFLDHRFFTRLTKSTTSSVSKKFMGKMKFSRLFRYWSRDSGYMVRFFRIM